jgi:hypothetical protein
MKTILFCTALAFLGCKKGSSASSCADAVTKGVDTMTAAGAKRMESAPPDMKAKMEEAATKLKGVMTNRCTEDKWSADVISCYAAAAKREDLRNCRAKLPPEQATKLQKEEIDVMTSVGFGGGGRMGMGMGGHMGSGAGEHPDTLQGNTGSAVAPAPTGSATTPPAAGSAK